MGEGPEVCYEVMRRRGLGMRVKRVNLDVDDDLDVNVDLDVDSSFPKPYTSLRLFLF